MAGISTNFDVEIDAPIFAGGLGGWTAVEGLGWDIAIEDREEGGNIFNKVNLANPSGILGSRFFDTPNNIQSGAFSNSAANRRIDLQVTFGF